MEKIMSGSLNKVMLIGNLGAEPEVRTTQSGGKIVNLRIATSESWKDKQSNERREATEWHRVVIFSSGLADIADTYLKKGAKVYIEGKLQTRKWTDQGGQDRYTTEIVLTPYNGSLKMLDNANRRGGEGNGGNGGSDGGYAGGHDVDDEIPF